MSNFKYKSFEEFTDDVKSLSESAMDLGNAIAKSKITEEKIASVNIRKKDFMRSVFSFLTSYSAYLIDLKSHLKDIDVDVYYDGNVMEFERFKDILYAKSDYPKILLFTNDLINLLNERTTDEKKISYLKSDSLIESFGYQSAGQILDDLNGAITMYLHPSTPLDVQNLKILSNMNIGDQRDVRWINDSIDKSLDAIIGSNGTDYEVERFSAVPVNTMFIGVIAFIEYALTILTLYAAKIMYVSEFAQGFEKDPITEYTTMASITENPSKKINIFTSLSDPYAVHPSGHDMLLKRIDKYLEELNIPTIFKPKDEFGISLTLNSKEKGNPGLKDIMKDNLLFTRLGIDENYRYRDNTDSLIQLKALMYTPNMGLNRADLNILNDMLDKISSSGNNLNSLESIKKYSRELASFTVYMLAKIRYYLQENLAASEIRDDSTGYYFNARSQFDFNNLTELASLAEELYRQIASACIDKFRYLEKKYNDISHEKEQCVLRDLKLNFDTDEEQYMMTSTPYVSRINRIAMVYNDPRDLYEHVYSAYLATLPEFKDSLYFKEVSDTPDNTDKRVDMKVTDQFTSTLANLFNKIMSFIKGSMDRIVGFVNSRSVKNAMDWVNANIKTLNNLTFRDDLTMSVLPYKETIAPPLEHLKIKMGSFNPESFRNQGYAKEFIKSLYPNEQVYKWFNEPEPSKKIRADIAYKNFILFNDNGKVYTEEVRPVTIDKATIEQYLKRWIKDVTSLGSIAQTYRHYTQDFVNNIRLIKSKLANFKLKDRQDDNTPDPAATINNFVGELSKTIQQLWYPVPNIILSAILTEYKYIQFAYNNRVLQSGAEEPNE